MKISNLAIYLPVVLGLSHYCCSMASADITGRHSLLHSSHHGISVEARSNKDRNSTGVTDELFDDEYADTDMVVGKSSDDGYTLTFGNESIVASTESTSTLMKYSKLWGHFSCDEHEANLPDEGTWTTMRQTYRDVVGAEHSSIPPPSRGYNGMSVPYFVSTTKRRGRGIFANAPIAQGSLIWSGILAATFRDGPTYIEYLNRLANGEDNPELVCNAIMWSEILPVPYPNGELMIVVNLDEGALCNDGGKKHANTIVDHEMDKLFPAAGGDRVFASRDIEKGEELLCDYSSYNEPFGWHHFGMGKKQSG